MNYLKVQWGLTGDQAAHYKMVDKLEVYLHEKSQELQEFISIWTGLWLKKWEERVRLLIGKKNDVSLRRVNKLIRNAQPLWNKLKHKSEIKEIIIETLVRNAEICGTSILSENLLKFELNDCAKKKMDISEPESILNLVNNTLRRARGISHSKGALIFLRISKNFFQFAK
jgi:hypothetical protein